MDNMTLALEVEDFFGGVRTWDEIARTVLGVTNASYLTERQAMQLQLWLDISSAFGVTSERAQAAMRALNYLVAHQL
jgi:hypothetical protein